MTKSILVFKDFSPYDPNNITENRVDISNVALDAHGQVLNYMDKVIFSQHKGRYSYGFYLGTTVSGKSAKIMYFYPTALSNHCLQISSLGASNVLKINWNDSVCPGIQPKIEEVLHQLKAGLSIIEVH